MNSSFYAKLAATNIRKNAKNYVPYILTCILTIMMFYMMCFLANNSALPTMSGGDSLLIILRLGTIVIGIFAVIFLFYTNSFLIKRRKKEIGLYNILGMEKKHIAKVLAIENLYVALISLTSGLFFGILLSKFMVLALGKMLNFKISFGFEISGGAVVATLILFVVIFLLLLLNNLRQIHLANPIELLRGKQVGEKEPKTKWLLTLIGVVSLGGGYYIAVTTQSPLDALMLFFVAVILVIIGTYCLFTAGSIAILKIMRKNKKYYYQSKHFISVSGMIYRMKQNAVGLANICILSTMVLVMISTTICLYIGLEDSLRNMYPKNFIISSSEVNGEERVLLENKVSEIMKQHNVEQEKLLNYRYMNLLAKKDGNQFSHGDTYAYDGGAMLYFISLSDYNRMVNQSESLSADEVFVHVKQGKLSGDTVSFGNKEYRVKEIVDNDAIDALFAQELVDTFYVVLPNETAFLEVNKELGNVVPDVNELQLYYGFDVSVEGEKQLEIYEELNTLSHSNEGEMGSGMYVRSAESVKGEFLFIYGGLFFLGIFLGSLFLMATVLIMYYKQISEGNDDRERFEIMQKVGMSQEEVKKTIHSQVVKVFFLPIIAAAVHIAFAFNVIMRLLAIFNLTNVALFATCTLITLGVFIIFYGVVYALTARTYYRIVKQ